MPMQLLVSLWDGSDWATDGGKTKANWTQAPFQAHFQDFNIDGCSATPKIPHKDCYNAKYWWNGKNYWQLDQRQMKAYEDVKKKYMNYDYCTDKNRHPWYRKLEMDVEEVNKKLVDELEEMGFPLARAMRALYQSGNSSLEDAINWIVEHEDDPEIDQMPSVPVKIEIENFEPSFVSEEVRLTAQKLREKSRKRNKEEDMKSVPNREKERIKAGKELQEAKNIAEENERKRFIALKKAEKAEENRAREKIRQKLQQDKLERRSRLEQPVQNNASLKTSTPMVQENKEMLPVMSTEIGVTLTTKVELMRECLRSLRRCNKHVDFKVKRAFETLLIYVRNVARNPDEDKFRKIRLSNPAFKERVGIFEQGVKFLELCGFERVEGGKYLFLPRDKFDMAVFNSAGNILQSAITNPFFGLLSAEE
ncbi:hypothetical protein QVD17_34085 [Tagetes erecta]|uniref:UBA domain-containing protein n=1 Tax=Tagetes erecta TaxID=13708 RepID=A0AAD8JXG3_TARER|nr:hypothetical protein QVD17_34085 [Tagetes erecta]